MEVVQNEHKDSPSIPGLHEMSNAWTGVIHVLTSLSHLR